MILAFDTETTGFLNNAAPKTDPSQPRMVQIGAVLMENDGVVRGELNAIIKPDGWTVPEGAAKVHGITTEIAEKYGVPLIVAMSMFNRFVSLADMLVAHNFAYDDTVVQAELARLGRPSDFTKKSNFCTMKATTNLVAIKTARGNKYPKLQEAYKFLFGSEFEGAHDAMADVRACARVYFELIKRNS